MARQGKIYFVRRTDGLIKIGFSAKLEARLAVLSKSHGPLDVIRIINGDTRREKQLHAQFKKSHEFGEWFRPDNSLLDEIRTLPEGDYIELSATENERRWKEGEQRFANQAKEKIDRLLQIRRQRTGAGNVDCLREIEDEHGIRVHFMTHLISGRAATVSAFAMQEIGTALVSEMTAYRDQLVDEVAVVERGEALPEQSSRKKYQKAG